MSTDYQNSILWRGEDPLKKKFKPSYDHTVKTTRYFPGKAPAWAREDLKKQEEEKKALEAKEKDAKKSKRRDRTAAAVVVEDRGASRLARLQAASNEQQETGVERQLRHRVVHDAQVLEDTVSRGDTISSIAGGIADKLKDKLDKKEELGLEKFEGVKDIEDLKAEVEGDDDEDLVIERKEVKKDDVKAEIKSEVKEEDDEDHVADMRQKARERALLKRKEEEDLLKQEQEDEVQEDEEESEYETESEEEDPRRSAILKPVFVSKSGRDTVKEKQVLEKEEEEAEVRAAEKLKNRKVESKSLVIDTIQKEADEEAAKALGLDDNSDVELIDDNDEINEAEEYEMWKIRELKRMKRDATAKMNKEKELEFIERRRNMTDEERAADDARMDDGKTSREDSNNFSFLQKYYHRGTFFQDKAETGEEPLYLRDYHEPTAEEKFDKQLLPKVMQVRRGLFGKKGQTKHTHLTDVDTTDMSAAWSQQNKQVQRYQERMAGASGVNNFARPGSSKSG